MCQLYPKKGHVLILFFIKVAVEIIGNFSCIQGLVLMLITLFLIGSSAIGKCFSSS